MRFYNLNQVPVGCAHDKIIIEQISLQKSTDNIRQVEDGKRPKYNKKGQGIIKIQVTSYK